MNITSKGLDLIKKYESFESKPYVCPAGKNTIGYGTTIYSSGKKVELTDSPITEEQAEKELLYHIEHRCYHALTGLPLNQNQFDALCSLIYNIGAGNFENSTVKRLINLNPNNPEIATAIQMWSKSGGKVLNGLVARRKEESELYFS